MLLGVAALPHNLAAHTGARAGTAISNMPPGARRWLPRQALLFRYTMSTGLGDQVLRPSIVWNPGT